MKTELFENADVTVSICYVSEQALRSLEITRGQFAYLFSVIEVRMSNIVIEFMSQRFRVDWDVSENAPRVDADLFLNG